MRQPKNKTMLLFLIFVATLALAACAEKGDPGNPAVSGSDVPLESFVIALLPQQNVFEQKKRYKPLADYLSRSLGRKVKTKVLDSYDAVYSELLQNKVDAAFFGSLSYVVMKSKVDLEPIARPLGKDGISTYKGLIFSVRGRGVTDDVSTWKGKRIALVHKSTTAGYIFPRYHLHKKGVRSLENYFSKVIYAGSHDAAILSVFTGDADIGCASDRIFNQLTGENPLMRERLIILASSAPVPADILGIRKGLDNTLKERLRVSLMNMENTPEGKEVLSTLGAVRFIETKMSEFGPIVEMLNTLGLKPEAFALESIGREAKPQPPGTGAMQ